MTLELRRQRAALVAQARTLLDTAEKANRNLTGEEEARYNAIMADVDAMKARIDRQEAVEGIEADNERSVRGEQRPIPAAPESRIQRPRVTPEYHAAFNQWLRNPEALSAEQRSLLAPERRAQSVGTASAGGYLVPEGFSNKLSEALLAYGGMRAARCTTLRTETGNDIPWPTINDTSNTGELLAENTGAATQDVTFSSVTLKAYKYSSKTLLVSYELLQDSAIDIDALLTRLFAIRIGRITNTHFTTGDNSSKPQGVVTGATLGKTGASGQTTTVTYNDLVDLQHSVDPSYRQNAQWMFADSTLKALKKLVDGDSKPLWSPGIAVKEPDTILGHPFVVNQDVAAMAASAKSILFGDFANYVIRDVMAVEMYRIVDKYIESGQVGFVAFARMDGRVIDAGTHPIKYYANAAS